MVGRALQGIVEGDLHAELAGAPDEPVEVIDGAQLRSYRRVPAGRSPNGPGTSRIGWPWLQCVVLSLAAGNPDRMHRRKVDDVESEIGHPIERLRRGGERAMRAGVRAGGAWKQLVPGGESRAFSIHPHTQLARITSGAARPHVLFHEREEAR